MKDQYPVEINPRHKHKPEETSSQLGFAEAKDWGSLGARLPPQNPHRLDALSVVQAWSEPKKEQL